MTYVKTAPARPAPTARPGAARRAWLAAVAAAPLALWLATAAAARAQTGPQPRLETVTLTAGMHLVKAELAVTPDQQATGLMFRREMGANEGMLFVSDQPGVRCFWMRNTLIPLAIAFIADDGTIVNIEEMRPLDETTRHCSSAPVRLALEMNAGWFAKRGIQAGFKLRGALFNGTRKP